MVGVDLQKYGGEGERVSVLVRSGLAVWLDREEDVRASMMGIGLATHVTNKLVGEVNWSPWRLRRCV